MSEPIELPKPRFQPGPPRRPANTRKPLPRHIVKQILAANSEAMQARPPWLEEMEARRRATKPERDKARLHLPEGGLNHRQFPEPSLAFAHAAVTADQVGRAFRGRQFALAVRFVGLQDSEKKFPQFAIDLGQAGVAHIVGSLLAGPRRVGVAAYSPSAFFAASRLASTRACISSSMGCTRRRALEATGSHFTICLGRDFLPTAGWVMAVSSH